MALKPPAKKRVPMRRPVVPTKTAPKAEEPKQEAPAPKADLLNRVARRPSPGVRPGGTHVEKPKEVETNVPKKEEIKVITGASEESTKSNPTSERQSDKAKPRPTSEGAVTTEVMRSMEIEARYKLFLSMNNHPEKFIPLLVPKDLPKKMSMRKAEALIRKIIVDKAPKAPKGSAGVYYCPYCTDYQPFHSFVYFGSTKCCGCSISTRDFYTSSDNGLFGKAD